jgi:LPXTG-motif cell wall-anchored protein
VAVNGALYIPQYTWDGNGEKGKDVRTLTQDGMTCTLSSVGNDKYYTVTCTNLAAGAALPQTGGSGTRKYTWCGLALMALAVGGAAYGDNRRRRRARKGAGAK